MSDNIKKGTVLSALMWAASELKSIGIESFRLDSEILLSEVLGLSRVQLYINYDRPMNQDEKEKFFFLIKRRIKREPIAYILNRKEFMSLQFYVDKRVLIPRPETECMIEWIIKNITLNEDSKVIDIGTGSGCIAASILKYTPIKKIFITDISEDALKVAEINLKTLCPDKEFEMIRTSLFEKIEDSNFDLIVSNPPYIKSGIIQSLMPEIVQYEPRIAIDGGENGDEIVRRLIFDSHNHLKTNGFLVFEHSEDFKLNEILLKEKFIITHIGKDYTNRYRFTVLQKI